MRYRAMDLLVLLGGATLLMLIGLADDRRGLDWRLRLGAEFVVAAAVVIWQGWSLTMFIPLPALT
jgi:UDP-GlcNAc:undecaprenyl-phosphate GlcNAc-1-phosphate transferase